MNSSTESLALAVTHVVKRFGGLTAVNDLSFDLRTNEVLGLIGPNGSGKTTMLNLISGALKPQSGQILFYGTDVTQLPPIKLPVWALLGRFRLFVSFLVFRSPRTLRPVALLDTYKLGAAP
jgi:branched-chain amino acid transport system ATP-binding protein